MVSMSLSFLFFKMDIIIAASLSRRQKEIAPASRQEFFLSGSQCSVTDGSAGFIVRMGGEGQ